MGGNGFTLVEIVIGMALISAAMVVAVLGFTTIVQLQQKAQTAQHVQQNTRYFMETISRDVRNSDLYQLSHSGTQLLLPNSINNDAEIRYRYNPEGEGHLYRLSCSGSSCYSGATAGENLVPDDLRIKDMIMEKLNQQSGANSPLRLYIVTSQADQSLPETDPYYYEYDATTVVVPRR